MSILLAILERDLSINIRPATEFGVGLRAIVGRALSWPQRPGLECLHDG
jgi:hypothetical protein